MKEEYSPAAMEGISRMAETIRKEDDFVLICHVSPDGDAMGSALAMLAVLQNMGKRVYAVCDGVASHNIAKVLPVERIEVFAQGVQRRAGVAIALDCADRERMGNCVSLFDAARVRLVIDHHVSNEGFGDQNLVLCNAAATTEIILQLMDAMNAELDDAIASYLYVGLSTDTGGFAYSNTTPLTLGTASRLLEKNFDFAEINTQLFRVRSVIKSRMLGKVLSNFRLACNGACAFSILDYEQLSELGALSADSEGLVDNLRDIEGVEVAIYVRENAKQLYKVSMRSRAFVDVAVICAKQEGGGHERAAGFTWHGERDDLFGWLLVEVERALEGEV